MKSAVDRYRLRASGGADAATNCSVARIVDDRAVDCANHKVAAPECARFDRKEVALVCDRLQVFHDADSWRGDDSAASSSVVAYLTGARTRRATSASPKIGAPIGNHNADRSSSSSGDRDEAKSADCDVGCCDHEAKTGTVRVARAGVYRLSAAAASHLVGSNSDVVSDRRSVVETRALFVRLDAAASGESVAEPVASERGVSNVIASCVLPTCHERNEVDAERGEKPHPAAAAGAHSTSRTAWTRLEILAHTVVLGVGDRLHFLVSTTADPPTRLEVDPTRCEATIAYCGPEQVV